MRILRALTKLAETGAGNVKVLQGPLAGVTRLRVGPWRVRYRYIEPGRALLYTFGLPFINSPVLSLPVKLGLDVGYVE
jgi:hypothetical protein